MFSVTFYDDECYKGSIQGGVGPQGRWAWLSHGGQGEARQASWKRATLHSMSCKRKDIGHEQVMSVLEQLAAAKVNSSSGVPEIEFWMLGCRWMRQDLLPGTAQFEHGNSTKWDCNVINPFLKFRAHPVGSLCPTLLYIYMIILFLLKYFYLFICWIWS